MEPRVRRIRPDEGATLKALRIRALTDAPDAFAQTVANVSRKTDADWAADAIRWATSSEAASFFAEADGTIIGMAGVFIDAAGGELVAMWTAPDARRQGIAQALIATIAQWCRDAGLTELRTGVAVGNTPAATLCEHVGFEASGEIRPLGSDPQRTERRYRRVIA